MTTAVVEVEKLSFSYSKKREKIIEQCSFTVEQGEIVGILGPSGSGKSTLLRLIAGLELPASGKITICGNTVVSDEAVLPPERRGVGMVFQDYALFPHLTVAKNIEFGLHKLSKNDRVKRRTEMIELIQLNGLENRYPHELSGGQQQRVALARALAPKPNILLMDEPFSNLDTELKQTIRTDLRNILKKANMTCMLVTHDQEDVEKICDRAIQI